MKKTFTFLLSALIISLAACKKNVVHPSDVQIPLDKVAPDKFDYSTSAKVNIDLTLATNTDEPISGVLVKIYLSGQTENGSQIFAGVTNTAGQLQATLNVPAGISQLVIDPAYVGLARMVKVNIHNNQVSALIGGHNSFSGDVQASPISFKGTRGLTPLSLTTQSINFRYPFSYSSTADAVVNTAQYPATLGRPKYISDTVTKITADMLKTINASLPESKPLQNTHPEYLDTALVNTLNVVRNTEVWVTYVSEGAANLNTLAYYTYKTGYPPATEAAIKNATFIFPNASTYGGGGGLHSGDRVNIGYFEAGTSIGFILISDSWKGNSIQTENTKYYSNNHLNGGMGKIKKQSVALYDPYNYFFLFGFEDLSTSISDNDFDDVVFIAQPSKVGDIRTVNMARTSNPDDADGDGVLDVIDDFPKDASLAYLHYYPSKNGMAQLMFEDNWPEKGDYDMNDLVVAYKYIQWVSAKNQVVKMQGLFMPIAAGASFKSGFGVELPISASTVQSATGHKHISNYIKYTSAGVEAGQPKAVIIPFDNYNAVLDYPDHSYFINTKTDKSKLWGDSVKITILFNSGVPETNINPALFNPFLISNLDRGREVHLALEPPTALANLSMLNTADDTSQPSIGRYYKAADNSSWAISYLFSIPYPIEGANINSAYLHYADWALSGGRLYPDWYCNVSAGYRNSDLLFLK